MNWIRWANVVLGIWLILSPFILGFVSDQATWNNIVVGILILTFTFATKSTIETAKGTT